MAQGYPVLEKELNKLKTGQRDSAGDLIFPDDYSQTIAYTNGLPTSFTFTDGTSTWVKTLTYTNGVITTEGQWVKQ